jgi:hypothetical protein
LTIPQPHPNKFTIARSRNNKDNPLPYQLDRVAGAGDRQNRQKFAVYPQNPCQKSVWGESSKTMSIIVNKI